MRAIANATSALLLAGAPVWAQDATTEDAAGTETEAAASDASAAASVGLAQVITGIENEDRFGRFESIEWNDAGYWEIEYRRDDGARIQIEIDSATGRPRVE